jgi:hypothetical protein
MHPARRLMRYDAWQRQKVTKVFTITACEWKAAAM